MLYMYVHTHTHIHTHTHRHTCSERARNKNKINVKMNKKTKKTGLHAVNGRGETCLYVTAREGHHEGHQNE